MRTSSWISVSSLAAPLLLLLGCSSDGGNGEACWNENDPSIKGYPSTATHRALVNVEQEVEHSAGGSEKVTRSVTASFSDVSTVKVVSQPGTPLMCDVSCEGVTGAPHIECPTPPCVPQTLEADSVKVEVGSGSVTLDHSSEGKFNKLSVADPLFGSAPIKVAVVGQTNTGYFPSYEQSLDPPDLISLDHPAPGNSQPVGTSDLKVSWKGGGGDYVLLEIRTTDASVTDKVRCLLEDDGCHAVGACALDWLEVNAGDTFVLTLARVKTDVKSLDSNTAATLSLVSQLETTLVR